MAIEWNDHESHGLPGVSEALDAAGVETGAIDALQVTLLPEPPPVEVDARLVAEGLGLDPAHVPAMVADRRIATLCERGVGEDAGLFRFTFYYRGQRFRLVTDADGEPVEG
ncbi:DUF6522 family protein [Arenimonas caeni]|jgi:hypothetical protein|uniref:DUF6522 family protein n=1 Tax=Arenimonas caeni TaxID=2058085 RepID=UPI002A366261|nr:DUF6522 family protein [Arenimonas caeni]MDY0021734.1 DUF6522 family protein [Arenimonas caeni]